MFTLAGPVPTLGERELMDWLELFGFSFSMGIRFLQKMRIRVLGEI
jgi:hypothetical protein